MKILLKLGLIFNILFLFSCSGGSVESLKENSLYDLSSDQVSDLEIITVDGNSLKLNFMSGRFSRENGQATIGLRDHEGQFGDNIPVNLPSKMKTNYVVIIPEGNSINQSFGLLGLSTEGVSIADGVYNYSGNAEVFINDGTALYGLNGSSNLLLENDGNNLSLSGNLFDLSGKKSTLDLSCKDCPVFSVVDITFPSGGICGDQRFCFNRIELKNSRLASGLTAHYVLKSEGIFFGPDQAEFGNVFSVNDTSVGSIEIRGALVAEKQ